MNIKTALVLGASGGTGKHLVAQLLGQDFEVRAIVRSKERFLNLIPNKSNIKTNKLSVIEGTVLDMSEEELEKSMEGCGIIFSCLGHNLTMKGVYGKPRRLVKDSIERICMMIKKNFQPSSSKSKLIVMGTNGAANPDGSDNKRTFKDRMLVSLIRNLVPPHADNEKTAEYLSNVIGKNDPNIEWIIVRPDDLIDGEKSAYKVFSKPYGTLFSAGETTRANVADFMSCLIMNDEKWKEWVYQMPMPQNIK